MHIQSKNRRENHGSAQEWPETNGEPKTFGDDLPVHVPGDVVPQPAEEPQPVDVPPPTGEDKVDETTDFEIVNHPQTGIPEYFARVRPLEVPDEAVRMMEQEVAGEPITSPPIVNAFSEL